MSLILYKKKYTIDDCQLIAYLLAFLWITDLRDCQIEACRHGLRNEYHLDIKKENMALLSHIVAIWTIYKTLLCGNVRYGIGTIRFQNGRKEIEESPAKEYAERDKKEKKLIF